MAIKIIKHRNNIESKDYMFGKIKESMKDNKIFIIVPDQFTLESEKIAIEKLDVKGLMDVEVLSFNRMSNRILEETGGNNKTLINKQGKHMILLRILSELDKELDIFSKSKNKKGFIELLNDLITEIKQSKISINDLEEMISEFNEDVILEKKLRDILVIYIKYEEYMEDKYIDNEDFSRIVYEKFSDSTLIKNSVVWIDGFDYFSPQMLDMIEQIFKESKETNIVLIDCNDTDKDKDLFNISNYTISQCALVAEKVEKTIEIDTVGTDYLIKQSREIAMLEKELFAYPNNILNEKTEDIEAIICSDYYSEVETVASKIVGLTRDNDYRFKDISVICNDISDYGSIIKRVFKEYGIPCFIDEKKSIMHNPFVEYTTALLEIFTNNYRYEDVFRLIKTNLSILKFKEYEKLENYVLRFGISGKKWKSEFTNGSEYLKDEYIAEINNYREKFINSLEKIEKAIKEAKTPKDKTEVLFYHIQDEMNASEKIDIIVKHQRENEELEYIKELTQIWNVIVQVFDQVVEIVGDIAISMKNYSELISTGFEAVEIGIIPTTNDQVLVGTIQRSRSGKAKAVFVIGVNDGVIPSAMTEKGILGDIEKEKLKAKYYEIGRNSDFRIKEEKLNIYKTFTMATEKLFISYTSSNMEGKELKSSLLMDRIYKIFPDIKKEVDISNSKEYNGKINTPYSTLKYLIDETKKGIENGEYDDAWKSTYNWYLKNNKYKSILAKINEGLFYKNRVKKINKELVRKLYPTPLKVSASRLELYSKCPYSHFIKYGVNAHERKIREFSVAEFGQIFHAALMMFGEEIVRRDLKWEDVTKEECNQLVNEIIENLAHDFDEGILNQDNRNKFKIHRIKTAVEKTAWILTEHIKNGEFDKFSFETAFGEGKEYPPITVNLPDDSKVLIEGRIDRIDLMKEDKDIYVKIIDYKSGGKELSLSDIANGFQLQLMLYLSATMNGVKEQNKACDVKPAGVFYLKIDDPIIKSEIGVLNEEAIKEMVEKEIKRKFIMDGLVLKDVNIIEKIDKDIASGKSEIIKVKKTKKGFDSRNKLYTEEEFKKITDYVEAFSSNICNELLDGEIKIEPKKINSALTSCTYCDYKTICQFDVSFPDNRYKNMENKILED